MERSVRRADKPIAKKRGVSPAPKTARPPAPEAAEVRMGSRRLLLLLGAAVIIIAGFIALAMGSTTLAPILLVVGYLGAVPYALIARTKRNGTTAEDAAGGTRAGTGG